MISWIQKTFQQHFRIIFAVLLAVTIISFIFTIGASPGLGRAEQRVHTRPFFDLNLATNEDQRKLVGDSQVSVVVQAGYMPLDQDRLQQYAFHRYAGLVMANRLGIPTPTSKEIEDHIKSMPRFASENGQFDAKKYADFRASLQKGGSLTEGEIARVLSDDIRVQRVQKLLAGPGYVLPSEVKKEVSAAETNWTLGVASVDYASFNPSLKPTDAELTKFFEDNAFRYEVGPQVSLSYVEFPAAAYAAQVKVNEQDVRAYYDANPARFPKPQTPTPAGAAPQVSTPNPDADFPLVRAQVEAALKMDQAQRLAAKAASDFAVLLYERKLPFGSPELSKIVSSHNLSLKDLPPFGRDSVPPALGANPQIPEEAFRLSKDRFVSDAIPTEGGSVVLFWKDTLPSRQPTFVEVRAKVSADYIEEERRKRFVEFGRTFRTQLAARLKSGEAFDKAVEAVAAANGVKAEAKTTPSFTLRQRPQDLDYSVDGALEELNKGDVSEMIRSRANKGLFVYAVDKKVPDLSETNPAFTSTRTQLAQFNAARSSGEYIQEVVRNELAKSNPTP